MRKASKKASNSELKPVKLDHTMAFMFETRYPQQLTKYAAELETLQDNYLECWDGLERKFDVNAGHQVKTDQASSDTEVGYEACDVERLSRGTVGSSSFPATLLAVPKSVTLSARCRQLSTTGSMWPETSADCRGCRDRSSADDQVPRT